MPYSSDKIRISPARLALAVKRLRTEQENLNLIASDPIAIVGMGCRFPGGADSPEEFWTALEEGRDCVGEVPRGRWKDADLLEPRMRLGAYLTRIDGFDAAYFGISPREALDMDPQQRLLLEVTWEALWDAGIEPGTLGGSDAGVFVAICNSDFSRLHFRDAAAMTAHAGVGSAHSVAAGRLSFLLNLKGPNLAIDSACSSSLVATHLACQSLRAGECGLALVAASSLKLLSDEVIIFSKLGTLASDGRCKTFDAAADGFVPGEGSGALILKRLSDALQVGDRVHAVIRGTAVNHDGRTTVLTAPNGLAQQAVLRSALKNAMLDPQEVSYVETHGTGTALGDPIEIEAISAVYGQPWVGSGSCVLGAVKTNLGHLESAAGIAGIIKAVLCLEHGEIPKNLHFHQLNPEISLAGTRLAIPTQKTPWARSGRARVAAISSFGLGGTNSHIIVEEAPLIPARNAAEDGRAIPIEGHRWQRQQFPLPEPSPTPTRSVDSAMPGDRIHPLLGRPISSPFVHGALFESELAASRIPWLADHRLGQRAIVPFAALLEIALAAVRRTGSTEYGVLRNFAMHEPLFLPDAGCRLQVFVEDQSIAIASESAAAWATHAKCSFARSGGQPGAIDLENLRARCFQEIPAADIYETLGRTGLYYGASFQTIFAAWSASGESLAHLRLSDAIKGQAGDYDLHPTLLDGCLQTVAVARGPSTDDDLFLPIGVDNFELWQRGATDLWAHTKIISSSAKTISANIVIADARGTIVARLTGFTAKRTTAREVNSLFRESPAAASANDSLAYELKWRATPPVAQADSATTRTGQRWLLIEHEAGNCRALASSLTQQGADCEICGDHDSGQSVIAAGSYTGVMYDARSVGGHRFEEQHPEKASVEFVFDFVRNLAAASAAPPRLWILTSSAVAVLPSEDTSVAQAPLWGLVRTLALEYPETSPVLIDAGPAENQFAATEIATMLAAEIAADGSESMVAFRRGHRYVGRLTHSTPQARNAQRLHFDPSGRLEDLCLEPALRQDPAPDQVEIRVRATGLNFRDVLTALGMLPPRSAIPGAECSGTIVRVGSAVTGLKAGDNVLAFAPASLQSYVNVSAEFVAQKPAAMTFGEAAGIPVAFLTAHYGLARLAKLSPGQTILIHAAAGGLGLAAVHLAQHAGARVFATAGSPEKREFLQRLGVEHVFDSRSLAFRDEVLAATEGAGVDVVLNSLAGDFIRASFDVTARGSCFLEVGKRGLWSEEEVAALGKSIRYFPFDLGDVALNHPATIAEMLRELMRSFSAGDLQPLPTALYSFDNATDAFRTMAQARHIGKIVLGMESQPPADNIRDIVSSGTVLITGGLGALGIEVARWLACNGARSIVLAGRTVSGTEEHSIAAELRSLGVEVAIERVDVASSDQLEKLLDRIRTTRAPLSAIFHAAGVVDDAVLANESWDSYLAATAAKIDGAWNLHRLTEADPIRCMVFFSSAASILGSSGQGSYAAGNAFLDALAHHRASRGLSALSVNWGAWASAGMAARLTPEQAARWSRQGVRLMEPAAALQALESAIEAGRTQVAIMDVDWQRLLDQRPTRRDAALFAELDHFANRANRGQQSAGRNTTTELDLAEKIRSAPAADQKSILSAHIKICARRVLGLEESAPIQDNVPLQDIGLDSLMALEMRNELAQSLGLTLAAGLLFDYPSVDQLTEHLLADRIAPAPAIAAADTSFEALDVLSEEEAERLLIQELDRAEGEKSNA